LIKLPMVLGVIIFSVMMARHEERSPILWGAYGGILGFALPFLILNLFIATFVVFITMTIANMIQR
ncbi:MAG: hypothetical protein KDA65_19470, partial [Planctomycetaceae bacterium]|nr:hypothetical protein [Planctomycetaceae bacterium]